MLTQVFPPSLVRSKEELHGGAEQGAVPSTQPLCGDTKLTEAGTKPAGIGPPRWPDAAAGLIAIGCCAVVAAPLRVTVRVTV
jgi:hypothetical protein